MILFLDFDGVLHPVGGKAEVFCRVSGRIEQLLVLPDVAYPQQHQLPD